MARKRKETETEEKKDPKKELLVRARECYKKASDADQANRTAALDDLKFANEPGHQWDANMKRDRGLRPCPEYNKVRVNGKRVINDIRANRPQIKVRAVENGDKKVADINEGLIRNIQTTSDFETVLDNAAEYQVDAGMAAWRVETKYSHDSAFEQDIAITGFKDPLASVYVDPNCQDSLKRDAEYWLVVSRVSNEEYDRKWPKAKRISFEGVDSDRDDDWTDNETVRICEYWYKEPYNKEIWLIRHPDGQTLTIDSESDEAAGVQAEIEAQQVLLLKKRSVKCFKIKMCILSGDSILEEADWAGSMFPFVMIYGEQKVIEGKLKWWGLHRFAKDAQRSYNFYRASLDETIGQSPLFKWWATAKQAEGLTDKWAIAHKENLPWMPYNPDSATGGGPPVMTPGAQVPPGLVAGAEISAQDLRDVSGLHEASFGEESGEKSGIALARKQNQAQIVTYNFGDNIAKGVKRTGEIILDLIPHIYDTERELRILGQDGAEDYVKVNKITLNKMGQQVRENDLGVGKYDITVTVGPNFSTMRQEAAEVYGQLFPPDSPAYPFVMDLIAKSQDYPYADEMAERLQLALPPQIQQKIAEGKDLPPEVMQAMAKVKQASDMLQQQQALVQAAAKEVEEEKANVTADKAKVDVALAQLKIEQANLKAARAEFDAAVVKAQAELQAAGSELEMRETQMGADIQQAKSDVESRISAGKQEISDTQNQQLQQALKSLEGVLAKLQQPQVIMAPSARPKAIRSTRDKATGDLIATPIYEDQAPA